VFSDDEDIGVNSSDVESSEDDDYTQLILPGTTN
jgi:hypothetical protein